MKKKFITIVAALALMAGIQANAQNNSNDNNTGCNAKQEQVQKGGKERCSKSPRMNAEQRQLFAEQAFDGIQLTDAQKAQLKTLNDQQQNKRQEMKAARDAKKSEMREQRQKNDSTMRAQRKQSKRDYLNGVKAVLTPDQYVVFLENIVVEGPAKAGKGGEMQGQRKGDKQMKGMDKGRKGDKQMAGRPAKDAKSANSGKMAKDGKQFKGNKSAQS